MVSSEGSAIPLTEVLSTLKEAGQPLRDVSKSPCQEIGPPWKNVRKPQKEARPPLLEDRKAKMKRANLHVMYSWGS